jgi:hypothetical protein
MLDCELMVKVVNHLRKTEQFQKLEESYIKQLNRKPIKEIAIGVGSVFTGIGISNISRIIELGDVENAILKGIGITLASGVAFCAPMVISYSERWKTFDAKEKIDKMIRNCYLKEKDVQDCIKQGMRELDVRESLENVNYNTRIGKIKDYEKDLKHYEIDYNQAFDYRTFIVDEPEEESQQMINFEKIDIYNGVIDDTFTESSDLDTQEEISM